MNNDKYLHYVILLNRIPNVETPPEAIKGHIAYLRDLERNGLLLMAGPFTDFHGGMVVIRAKDRADAERIAQTDPFVRDGLRACEIRTWMQSCEENNHLGRG